MREAWLLTPGRVPYAAALDAMHSLVERRLAGEIPDTLLLLEHPPVYTAGRRTRPEHLLLTEAALRRRGAEVHHVDRGGSVTFHGPGQLVGYPIVHLGVRPSLAEHVHRMTEVIIRAASDLGVELERSDEVGVWACGRKVCAIGVKSVHRVTYHGFAVNCSTDLSWFDAIVPCGLADRGVTSLSELAGRPIGVEDALPVVAKRFARVFDVALTPGPSKLPEILRLEPALG